MWVDGAFILELKPPGHFILVLSSSFPVIPLGKVGYVGVDKPCFHPHVSSLAQCLHQVGPQRP